MGELMQYDIVCVASGPSLNQVDCALVCRSGLPVIAVNNRWVMVSTCQYIYAADCCWWEEYQRTITVPAERWCSDTFTARRFGINCLPSALPGSQPEIPDSMTWGQSLNLNVSLLSALGQCNRDKADIKKAEQQRSSQ
ncbi:hypothetical protein REW02_001765 [Klebsiella aerogenes]|nr:hypothetical protein [Klebsiella aerogenes]